MADWYVKSNDELGPWWANFFLRQPEFEAKYPILATKKAELDAIANWVAYWGPARHAFDESSKQLTGFFNTIVGNDPSADPPTTFSYTLPAGAPPDVAPGIEKLIRDVRREVVGYTNYAKADGEGLGFEATAPASISAADVKPTIKAFSSAHDYGASIVVAGRNGVVSWDVYLTRKGGNRTKYATCDGKTANIFITPTTPGEAEQVQLDIQLRKNNANYGQPSDPVYVTINP